MTGTPVRAEHRLARLDALRAVCILAVFVTHVSERFPELTHRGLWINRFCYDFNLGRVGVVTFFCISGFLIPSSLHGSPGRGVLRFAITRFFRLFPAFAISVIPSVLTYHIANPGHFLTTEDIWWNFTMVPGLFGAELANGGYWTLSVEIFFYFTCAFLFAGGVLGNIFVLSTIMAVCFGIFVSSQGLIFDGLLNPPLAGDTFLFHLHLSCMFWGAFCRRFWDGARIDVLSWLMFAVVTGYWLVYLPLCITPLLFAIPVERVDVRLIAGYGIGLAAFLVFVFLIDLRSRFLVWLGRISYSFYLLHQFGFYFVFWVVYRVGALHNRHLAYYLVASFVVCTALAALSYHLVEAPMIQLGKRLTRRLRDRPSGVAKPGRTIAGTAHAAE